MIIMTCRIRKMNVGLIDNMYEKAERERRWSRRR